MQAKALIGVCKRVFFNIMFLSLHVYVAKFSHHVTNGYKGIFIQLDILCRIDVKDMQAYIKLQKPISRFDSGTLHVSKVFSETLKI